MLTTSKIPGLTPCSQGFCLYNAVAVAAAWARYNLADAGIKRITILDFDIHHGNGTQQIVEALHLLPLIYEFKPDLLLLSAGFDAHLTDPMTDIH
uniref:histone deacetylase n=1 Tax=Dermatophagoides pteronyssinus TaxID=6956 RepID=A0A6P6Y4J1_DERPT|nr:uncharacterized protein LOC113794490 [Dermatophagoides pteronyssinus]